LGWWRLLATGLALAALANLALAGVYKWTDAQGRTHYSDAPPQNSGAQQVKLHINSYDGPAIVRPRTSLNTDAPPARADVVMYTTSWCASCKKAKAYLTGKGVPFRELDVEQSAEAHQQFQQLGGKGVPLILVGNKRMDGFDPGAMDGLLQEAGIGGSGAVKSR
jgi:glutaredoxin